MYKLPWQGTKVQSILQFVLDTLMGRITSNNTTIEFSEDTNLVGLEKDDWSWISRKKSDTEESLQSKFAAIASDITNLQNKIDYVAPKITTFTISPSTTTYEIGKTIATGGITFSWVLNKEVTGITFDGQTLEDVTARSATNSSAFSSTKIFTLSVTDGDNTATSSKTISFCPYIYYGSAAEPTSYSSSFILGLSSKILKASRGGSYTMTVATGQYGFLCIPASYGTPTVKIGGFVTELENVTSISHTNASGYTQNYNIYRTSQSGLGTLTMDVS